MSNYLSRILHKSVAPFYSSFKSSWLCQQTKRSRLVLGNQKKLLKRPRAKERTIWCGFWATHAIRKRNWCYSARVHTAYRSILPTLFGALNLEDIHFQQSGATAHASWETIKLLRHKFRGHVISRLGNITHAIYRRRTSSDLCAK